MLVRERDEVDEDFAIRNPVFGGNHVDGIYIRKYHLKTQSYPGLLIQGEAQE